MKPTPTSKPKRIPFLGRPRRGYRLDPAAVLEPIRLFAPEEDSAERLRRERTATAELVRSAMRRLRTDTDGLDARLSFPAGTAAKVVAGLYTLGPRAVEKLIAAGEGGLA